jgi:hypothetical protein
MSLLLHETPLVNSIDVLESSIISTPAIHFVIRDILDENLFGFYGGYR